MVNKTFHNIIFVGGIHGVGKSTICHKLVADLNINYLSASDVLRWRDINADVKNKLVNDISDTQDRLIKGLHNIISPDKRYILDGHFCLFNKDGIATKIPLKTFSIINPIHLVVVIGDPVEISNGLKSRDKKTYSKQSLENMQKLETQYANEISNELDSPLFMFDINEYNLTYTDLLSQLYESFA